MNTESQNEKVDTSPKKSRHFLKWFGGALIVAAVMISVGAVYESVSESNDARAYPPPGKLVDVGGYRLHINCTGAGSPTVVIETGWGDSSSSWGWVQPAVAKTTRVCTYDRAGVGWSEVSPEPRTAREFAKELHTLLANANEHSPYVLVGHSLGGYTMRVFAHDYSAQVVGLVFVDPQNISITNVVAPNPAPKPGTNSFPMLMARIGIVRLLAVPLGSVQDLPEKDKQADTANAVSPRSVQTFLDEGMGMSEGVAQARAVKSLGKLPIIVLSRGKEMDIESAASQARYLKLSTNSLHLVADQSDHRIMIEQPKAVVDAINNMIKQIRADGPIH
jgi:pimeloyl-ACP methyl ester carboxylesterase